MTDIALNAMRELIAYALALLVIRIISLIPLRLALALGRFAGRLTYHVFRFRRSIVLGNLRHVFGGTKSETELRRIAAANYENTFMTIIEVLRSVHERPEHYRDHTEFDDFPRLLSHEESRSPLIICCAHSGNFDHVGSGATAKGLTLHIIYKKLKSPRFNRLLVRTRERLNLNIFPKGARSFQKFHTLLKEGRIIALLPDQNARHGLEVDFLGKPASTFLGPAVLHRKAGAPILVLVGIRRRDDPTRHFVYTRLLPDHEPTDDREADLLAITRGINEAMGEIIREHPEHYLWFHRRWGKEASRTPPRREVPAREPAE